MGLLIKTILIILGIYLIFKSIFRGVISYFLEDASKNMNVKLRRQQDEMARQKKKQEGRITINYQPRSKKNFNENEGDYIDFEEIK